jgi:dihydrolipoamide dehydrogenase
LKEFGFEADNPRFNFDTIIQRSRKVAAQLSNGVKFLMKKHKITVIDGFASFTAPGQLSIDNKGAKSEASAKSIIIATGARARELPNLKADGKLIWTYREAMTPAAMPKSLLVIGSGAIGIEFASFYRTLGAEVTVVEVMDRVLPVEDEEISAFAQRAFVKQGMKILTGATVEALDTGTGMVSARIKMKDGKTEIQTFERAILAVGIAANTEGLNLDKIGVKTDRGHIVIDPYCQTSVPGHFAIGDVVGAPWLAHKAMHEGVLAAERIAGVQDLHPMDTTKIPGCTYCWPQVASVGLTEAKAKAAGHEVKVGRFPFIGNGKAIAMGEADGLIKTVFDAKTGELLGAHMVGAEVTELIQGYGVARTLEATEADLMATIFPHPTLSEMMHEAVLDAYGKALHI